MEAFSAIHSHPDTDIEKGSQSTNKLYYNAISRIPYLTGGQSGEDLVMADRMKSIERYKEMQRNLSAKPEEKLVKKTNAN